MRTKYSVLFKITIITSILLFSSIIVSAAPETNKNYKFTNMSFDKTTCFVNQTITLSFSYEAKYWAGLFMPGKSYPVVKVSGIVDMEKKYPEQQHSWLFNSKTLTLAITPPKEGKISCTVCIYSGEKKDILEIQKTISITATKIPLPTISVTAKPTTISVGGSSTLTWVAKNTNTVTISNNLTSSGKMSGSIVVKPGATTTYTFIAQGASGVATATITVTIKK